MCILATQQPWLTENTVLDIGIDKNEDSYGGLHVCSAWGDPLPKRNRECQSVVPPEVFLRALRLPSHRRHVPSLRRCCRARPPLGLGPVLVIVSLPRFDRPPPPPLSFYYAVLTPDRNASKRWRAGALNEGCSSRRKKQRHVTSSTAGERCSLPALKPTELPTSACSATHRIAIKQLRPPGEE